MATNYLEVVSYGSRFYQDPVTTATLPALDPQYTVRLATDTGILWYLLAGVWTPIDAQLSPAAAVSTNSVAQTITLGVLSSDLRISANAADVGSTIVALDVEGAASVGLRAQISNANVRGLFSGSAPVAYNAGTGAFSMAQASGAANGYLASGDWTTFNNKEPAVAAGLVTQYYRGDKSFQTLNVAAIVPETGGAAAGAGTIGEVLTGTQAANTAAGVGATGVWGNVLSVSLTAGSWMVQGSVGFNANGAELTTALQAGISASASGVGITEKSITVIPFANPTSTDPFFSTPWVLVNIAAPTTYYLNTMFSYTSGAPKHRGYLTALRIAQ